MTTTPPRGLRCRVQGCGSAATGYGVYCATHKSRERRHGHPQQIAVTAAALRPHRKALREWVARRESDRVWSALEEAWGRVAKYGRGEVLAYGRGQGLRNVWHREACYALVKVSLEAEARDIVETVLAMFLLREADPQLFRSETAFLYQVGRRYRALAPSNTGGTRKGTDGDATHTYLKDFRGRSLETLGRYLVTGLGGVGVAISRSMAEEQRAAAEASRKVYEVLLG